MTTGIRGMVQTKAALAKLNVIAPIAADRAADVIKDGVAEDARSVAPVLTGALRDSIVVIDEGVASGVDYDVFVEYGSIHGDAQPFMRPAADGSIRHVPAAAAEAGAIVEGAF